MTLPSIDYFIGVKLTLKLKKSPHTSKVVYFTNRPDINTDAWTTQYWPIIQGFPRLGVEAGDVMPDVIGGGIVLDNTIGSFGYKRKFSDLLERYTAIKGAIEVYVSECEVDAGVPSFDSADLQWSGQVQSIGMQHTKENSSITLNVDMELIPDRRMNLPITSDMFPDCPEDNLGKILPIVASGGASVYVPAYAITSSAAGLRLAYAADLGDENAHTASTTGWYHEYDDGSYVEITSADTSMASGSSGSDALFSFDQYRERIIEIPTTSHNHFLGGILFWMEGSGVSGTTTARMAVRIYEIEPDELTVGKAIATGGVDMATSEGGTYDASNAAGGTMSVSVGLDRPVVLDRSRYRYAVGVSWLNWQATDASWLGKSGNTARSWHNDIGGISYDGIIAAPRFQLNFITLENPSSNAYTINEEGYLPAYVEVRTPFVGGEYGASFVESINPILKVQGLRDDAAGSIVGASAALPRVHHFLEAITQEYDGSTWEPSAAWDFDTYIAQYNASYAATGTRSRILQGFVDGDTSLFDMVEQVCRDTASRVGITSAGKLFPFPWGDEQTVQLTIPPHDIEVLGRQVEDLTTVVNRVTIAYTKSAKNMKLEKLLASNQQVNYEAILDWSSATNGRTAALGAESVALYGPRPLEQIETAFIGDDTSAETLAESYFARFPHPMMIDSISIPWDYKALQMFHVIKYAHPMLDTFYGGYSDSGEPVDDDGIAATLKHGHYWYSAKTYRGLILGRYLVLPTNGGLPRIELKILVLQNYPGDPT
jgi:hypothetical protein